MENGQRKKKAGLWYTLLLIPFIALLWPPFYSYAEPSIGGLPFFYWYQFLWVGLTAVLTWIVYVATREN
ncbi:hypothetical protein CVD28_23350 [Bacillus sp. M6-12]|uniref:DUF3311 domain-containing protein n=1 Tax=Bacillus sp. M6-12 TaxID=2054166 RepID=UPI000C75E7CC|nr:hypothetical protein CVD28_23350 [Bacillus sp. M6-12]